MKGEAHLRSSVNICCVQEITLIASGYQDILRDSPSTQLIIIVSSEEVLDGASCALMLMCPVGKLCVIDLMIKVMTLCFIGVYAPNDRVHNVGA